MTTPTSHFYNASTSVYPKNGPSGFKVTLPNVYELHGDEWQVGLAILIYPRTWVNMPDPTKEELKEFRHQWVFYAWVFSPTRPASYNDQTKYPEESWFPLHMAQGHYETVEDFMKGIRQALRDEFGQSLADQQFKFAFDEDAKQVTITIPAWSCLVLNPWMVDMLESDTLAGLPSSDDTLRRGISITNLPADENVVHSHNDMRNALQEVFHCPLKNTRCRRDSERQSIVLK